MGIISFLSELISTLLEKDPGEEVETSHSKFVDSVADTLKSKKASNEDTLQALRDLGAVVYIGTFINLGANAHHKCKRFSSLRGGGV